MLANPVRLVLLCSVLSLASGARGQSALGPGEAPGGLSAADWSEVKSVFVSELQSQRGYFKSESSETLDQFGYSVAASGNTIVVGVPGDDSKATGVNGDAADNTVIDSGAAYVFVRSGTTWSQEAYLKASNTGAGDEFGHSVAISGDTIVVGAWREGSDAVEVDNDQLNDFAPFSGAAYVFVRDSGVWSQEAYLKASNTQPADTFGQSVAVSGDTVVVGAVGEASNALGVGGDQLDNSEGAAGAAYVYFREDSAWSFQEYLKASANDSGDQFGFAVAISGDTVAVSAFREDSGATTIDGDDSDNGAADSGAVYVFLRVLSVWSPEAYIKPSNTDSMDQFGTSLALSGDTLVVGSPNEDSNGTESDDSVSNSGAAYVFSRDGSDWSQQEYLKASNSEQNDFFGNSVSASGNRILIGAVGEDSNAEGVDGDESNNSATGSGAAYSFYFSEDVWGQRHYIKASNTQAMDVFGISVAVSNDMLLVGAVWEDSNAVGIDGDKGDNSQEAAGAAYTFRPCDDSVKSVELVRLGTPPNPDALRPGKSTGPVIGAVWDPWIDHDSFVTDAVLDLLFITLFTNNTNFIPHGTLLCLPPKLGPFFTAAPGDPFQVPIPDNCLFVGLPLCTQGVSAETSVDYFLTNALDITIGTY